MKNLKIFYLCVFLSAGFLFVGCGDDEDDEPENTVTITIEEPVNDETIAMADCAEVHIHIDFEASDENHEVEVVLHPEGDVNDKIIDYDEHGHDQKITFEQEVDLCSYPAGTCFHLEVSACVDHDCEEKSTAEAEFCLQ
ncbi:MAG: hypothetical protein AB8F74_19765 [Saprospiraceae bacterium]